MTTYTPLSSSTMKEWIETNQSRWMEDFYTFLRFPSISSEAEFKSSIHDCINWLESYLKELDFTTEIWPTEGHPILFASNLEAGPDQPTLLIYHHYDVQPADPLEEWKSSPFEPEKRGGEVYARGAQDNKGQCFYTLQALKLLMKERGKLPINIKLCIEGEEEIGSPSLTAILDEKSGILKADYLAIVDAGIRTPETPALALGIRGIVTIDVEFKGSETDLHSGSNGGIAHNPLHALVNLLATTRDSTGRITIPGFYRDVKEMLPEEKEAISFHFDDEKFFEQTGVRATGGEAEYSVLERAWTRPTLEFNGLWGGYSGTGFKTVIPARAFAKVSCRLVPDQDPEEIGNLVAKYLEEHAPAGVEVKVKVRPGVGKAIRVSPNARVVQAFSKAFEEAFESPCEFILEGGSIPITAELAAACGGETVLLGLGLPTDQIHAPNEHFGVDRLKKGMLIMARSMELLAADIY